ncbi:hypothetical protein BDP55DRAFT_235617 [Colletotrichum godetiae]|uniref:Uncharacterized protein n=1 Tax=Colletotrichum godetiae TaxID=1209918 RepID=A0AAJ0AGQ8_9PEZI|nr:uncharacterized protein BDP55DRAFT_235617 [Colletotrichum godetiae]KAK1672944.1 hypothetical protein BDP55DRAFT_235617 [Colletotrichum godetiae]
MNPQLVSPTTFAQRQVTLALLLTPATTLSVSVSHLISMVDNYSRRQVCPCLVLLSLAVRPFSPCAPAYRYLPLTCLISRHTIPSWTTRPRKRFQQKKVPYDHDHIISHKQRSPCLCLSSRRTRPSRRSVPCPLACAGHRSQGERGDREASR